MTREESEAIFMAAIMAIDAKKRAGLKPTAVLAEQLVAIFEEYQRQTAIEIDAKTRQID